MRCADGHYYVVKFQNNPQHRRILVNELLGTRLAARLGLPTVPVAIIDVPEELIRLTPDLAMEHPRSRSLPARRAVRFSLSRRSPSPDAARFSSRPAVARGGKSARLRRHAGFRQMDLQHQRAADAVPSARWIRRDDQPRAGYRTIMIDQGFCFSAGDWRFPDAPLRGLYARNRVL